MKSRLAKSSQPDTDKPDLNFLDMVSRGQVIRTHIPNCAPIGGETQYELFVIKAITSRQITGVDEIWNDKVTITRTENGLYLNSGGKSGEVIKIEIVETESSGTPIHGKEKTVFELEQ